MFCPLNYAFETHMTQEIEVQYYAFVVLD